MAGAPDGVRVIDFGQYIAGPLCAMLLADQGADVVRVDPPGGPVWQTPANATWNRGKRSIVLDLARPEDRETARRLVESADVVVENFRPGVMDRLGLGAQAMLEADPRLVYCSLPGFAVDDPRAEMPGWEGVVLAGTATYAARTATAEDFRPVYTAIPVASCYAAFLGATSIAMALVARERDGAGQRIEVPLFDATFGALGFRGQHPFSLRGLAGLRTSQYRCADGRWVQFHSGNKNVPEFMEAAGIASWRDEGLLDPERLRAEPELAAELNRRMEALFASRTAQEWEDLIALAGSEATVCRTTAEWVAHPHARESQAVVEVDDPVLGRTLQPGINARLSATPGAIRGPAPLPDADRDAILAELGGTRSSSGSGRAEASDAAGNQMRAALDGVRVLDLCAVLAGPTCGRTLAEFGADVVKIDNARRDAIVFYHDVNRGKRSIVLDLKSPEGQEVFWRLVEDADVVVQNYRKGVAESLGIGYEDVRTRRPDIVYASINAYGMVGPWADRPGHEQLAQAATGMQVRFGGDGPPVLQTNAVNDYGTGFMGAYAVALALLHRHRTGEGQHVDTALAYTAVTLQSPYLVVHEGTQWDEPRGHEALGSGPLHRAYRAADGWLFLGARRDDLPRLAAVEGMEGIAGAAGESLDALASELERRFSSAPVADWVSRLAAAGIGAQSVVVSPREVMTDPRVVEHGLSVTRAHDGGDPITTTGAIPRLSRTPVRPGRPAPRPGSDAREILDEIGMGQRYDALVASRAIVVEGIEAL